MHELRTMTANNRSTKEWLRLATFEPHSWLQVKPQCLDEAEYLLHQYTCFEVAAESQQAIQQHLTVAHTIKRKEIQTQITKDSQARGLTTVPPFGLLADMSDAPSTRCTTRLDRSLSSAGSLGEQI